MGIGQTGSGKTLAFLLPALQHIAAARADSRPGGGPRALVLAPTRELAKQIEEVARGYRRIAQVSTALWSCSVDTVRQVKTVCCIGGEGRNHQIAQYDAGAELMIATPGRINDFLEAGDMVLSQCGFVVLDEADRMLDMGKIQIAIALQVSLLFNCYNKSK